MASSLADRLQAAAECCCKQVVECEESAAAAMEFINILGTPVPGEQIEDLDDMVPEKREQCEGLLQLCQTLLDPSSTDGQILLERIGWELPQVLVSYSRISDRCRELSAAIIDGLASTSSPRELLVLFMEAINMDASLQNVFFCRSIIHGLGIVFSRVQKRHIDYFRDVMQGLLRVAKHAVLQLDQLMAISQMGSLALGREKVLEKGKDLKLLEEIDEGEIEFIKEYVLLAQIIQEGYSRGLRGEEQLQRAHNTLGLFVLQLLGIASSGVKFSVPSPRALNLLVEMSRLLHTCGLSFPTLLAGNQILYMIYSYHEDGNTENMTEQDDGDHPDFDDVLETKRGAALAVYWGLKYKEVADAFGESLVLSDQMSSGNAFLEAFNLASTLFVSNTKEISDQLGEKGVSLMQSLLHDRKVRWSKSEEDDWSTITVHVMPALQLLQSAIVTAGKQDLREQTFAVFLKVIKEVLPEQARYEALKSLIATSPYPSMVSLLLTTLKDEILRSWPGEVTPGSSASGEAVLQLSPFVNNEVLELLENVFLSAGKGILSSPSYIDSIMSALNVLRCLLLKETTGKSNFTGIRSKDELTAIRRKWLLPLREVLGSLQLGLEKGDSVGELSLQLDLLSGVLHRCLELVDAAVSATSGQMPIGGLYIS